MCVCVGGGGEGGLPSNKNKGPHNSDISKENGGVKGKVNIVLGNSKI